MIFFSILLMDFVQVVCPALAVCLCGETLTSYAASAEPNDRSAPRNSLRRGIIWNAAFRRYAASGVVVYFDVPVLAVA